MADREPVNLLEYEEAARAVLPRGCYDFIAGGAEDEVTLRESRAAFARWRLLPRVMRGVSAPALGTTVLGQPISMPVILAPIGFQQLAHSEGEPATARAARRAETIFTLSTAASRAIEEVAPHAGPWWFQLYLPREREIARDLVRRAEAAGAGALMLTVDVPLAGRREADARNRFALPEGVTMANFRNYEAAAAVERKEAPPVSPLVATVTAWTEPAPRWEDLQWLASLTSLPLIVKGVLAPEDARIAFDCGAAAVVVSNHGGRQLDSAVASLDALTAVVDAVAGRGEVLLDGGVRRGTDVLKALALGARAVLLGRPCIWGLAVDGEAGVLRVLELLRAELIVDLTLCGRAGIGELDRSLVVPAGPLFSPRAGD